MCVEEESSHQVTMNLLPPVIHPVMPVGDFTVFGKTFDLNVETQFVTISQEDLDKYLSSSTPGPIPSKKRKFDGDNADLSSGWLSNLFSNMEESYQLEISQY